MWLITFVTPWAAAATVGTAWAKRLSGSRIGGCGTLSRGRLNLRSTKPWHTMLQSIPRNLAVQY